jgi:hypothetical protein
MVSFAASRALREVLKPYATFTPPKPCQRSEGSISPPRPFTICAASPAGSASLARQLPAQTGAHQRPSPAPGKTPARSSRILATLSPAARGALAHLRRVTRTPAALFFAEYGAVRHARTHAPWRSALAPAGLRRRRTLLRRAPGRLRPETPAHHRLSVYAGRPDGIQPAARPQSAPASARSRWIDLPAEQRQPQPPGRSPTTSPSGCCSSMYELALDRRSPPSPPHARAGPAPQLAQQPESAPRRACPRAAAARPRPPPPPAPRALSRRRRRSAPGYHGVLTPLGWTWLAEAARTTDRAALARLARCSAPPSPAICIRRRADSAPLAHTPPPRAASHACPEHTTTAHLAEHMLQQAHLPDPFWVHQVDFAHSAAPARRPGAPSARRCCPFGAGCPSPPRARRLASASQRWAGIYWASTAGRAHSGRYGSQRRPPATADAARRRTATQRPLHQRRPGANSSTSTDDGWRVELSPRTPPRISRRALTPYAAHHRHRRRPARRGAALRHSPTPRLPAPSPLAFGWPQLGVRPGAAHLCAHVAALPSSSPTHFAHSIPVITLQTHTLLHTSPTAPRSRRCSQTPSLRPLIDDLLAATTPPPSTPNPTVDQSALASRRLRRARRSTPSHPAPAICPPAAALWLAGTPLPPPGRLAAAAPAAPARPARRPPRRI